MPDQPHPVPATDVLAILARKLGELAVENATLLVALEAARKELASTVAAPHEERER